MFVLGDVNVHAGKIKNQRNGVEENYVEQAKAYLNSIKNRLKDRLSDFHEAITCKAEFLT